MKNKFRRRKKPKQIKIKRENKKEERRQITYK